MSAIDLKNDLLYARNIIQKREEYNRPFWLKNGLVYDKVYPWTNEEMSGYSDFLDLEDKRVFAITSSGYHALNACLLGSKEIDCVDINKFAKYYASLKIAMIKAYDLKYFKKCFKTVERLGENFQIIKKICLKDLKEFLSFEEYYFWDNLLKNYDTNLNYFYRYDGFKPFILPNYITDIELYKKLRDNIFDCSINYYDIDLDSNDIPFRKKYDCIFLSNVLEHVVRTVSKEKIVHNCMEILNDDGQIIIYRKTGASDDFLDFYYYDSPSFGDTKILLKK